MLLRGSCVCEYIKHHEGNKTFVMFCEQYFSIIEKFTERHMSEELFDKLAQSVIDGDSENAGSHR